MKVYLIRHGETTGDIEDRYGGDYDDNLTKTGQQQAKKLSKKLANRGIEVIFVSPLRRAQQTAKKLSETLQVEIQTVKGIKERNRYGILTGMVKSEAKEKYSEASEKVNEFTNTVEGAEKYSEFVSRITTTFNSLLKEKYQTIAVVTHGGPLSVIFEKILKVEWGKAEDCGYAEIEHRNGKLRIVETDGINFKKLTD